MFFVVIKRLNSVVITLLMISNNRVMIIWIFLKLHKWFLVIIQYTTVHFCCCWFWLLSISRCIEHLLVARKSHGPFLTLIVLLHLLVTNSTWSFSIKLLLHDKLFNAELRTQRYLLFISRKQQEKSENQTSHGNKSRQ